ncbi:MAG: hypothetical protein WC600_08410 [Desulfobaccales bacterium]
MAITPDNMVKTLLKHFFQKLPDPLIDPIKALRADIRDARDHLAYQRRPRIPPPHIIKFKTLINYSRRHNLQILIETGTYEGEMVRKCRRHFRQIWTIELDKHLAEEAARRFSKLINIHVVHGESSLELSRLLQSINEPALFWLDAHYSGGKTAKGITETPLLDELQSIGTHEIKCHVILIDDVRYFGQGDYPTIAEIEQKLLLINSDYKITISEDILCCEPPLGNEY